MKSKYWGNFRLIYKNSSTLIESLIFVCDYSAGHFYHAWIAVRSEAKSGKTQNSRKFEAKLRFPLLA